MAEFFDSKEKIVDVNEPVVFENKTDSSFDIDTGVIFHESGIYEVSILGNRTIVSKITERNWAKWNYIDDGYIDIFQCSRCKRFFNIATSFCPYCGATMLKECKER